MNNHIFILNDVRCYFNDVRCFFNGVRYSFNVIRGVFNDVRCFFNGVRCSFNGVRCVFNGVRCVFNGLQGSFKGIRDFISMKNPSRFLNKMGFKFLSFTLSLGEDWGEDYSLTTFNVFTNPSACILTK